MILFYGQESPFSNFHRCNFTLDGKEFTSVEKFYMYNKALYFGDTLSMWTILGLNSPGKIKKWGQKVKPFDEVVWNRVKYDFMLMGVRAKFIQDIECHDALKDSVPHILAEASPSDLEWGIGLSKGNPLAQDKKNWRGKNLLGKVLMQVRKEL